MDSYADWLRARDDGELRTLLSARPELITPVPADLTALGARAATSAAVSRALDRLDRFALAVLETLLVLPQPAARADVVAELTKSTDAEADDVTRALDRLRAHGLVWDDGAPGDPLRTAPGLRQSLPHPAGLGPPAAELFAAYPVERLVELVSDTGGDRPRGFPDTARLVERLTARLSAPADLIEDAGPQARAALEQLAWGPPVGRVTEARRAVRTATAETPIERLLARGLLAATDDRTVTLPREVALHLRGGLLFRDVPARPPALEVPAPRRPDLVVRTAAGQAFTAVRLVEDLLERWGVEPPAVLRSGGLAVRDLRAAATALDVAEWQAALLAEVAYAAGLLARSGDRQVDGEWLPTRAFDLWRLRETADRWTELAVAWLRTDRVAGLAGERDDRDRVINALGDEPVRGSAPQIRRAALRALDEAGGAADADLIRARLDWERPRRRGALRDRLVGWTLREAELLGLTGFGVLASYARALLADGDPGAVAAELAGQLPRPVDQVLIQADLTAVAPGPLVPDLAHELALAADVESTGGATVYRFTAASVRRALDAGRSAAELTDLLTRHSTTPLPQPLTYLIEDVARRHGRLRVGTMTCYVRADDPSVLDEVLADRRTATLPLQRLAPTVLASRLSAAELLEALRGLGLSPVAESPEGGVVITRPDAHRAEPSAHPAADPVRTLPADDPDPAIIAAAVRALRAGEEAARQGAELARTRPGPPPGEPPRSPSMATVEELRRAVERGARVWIGYLDQQGQASSRIVEPVRVDGGFLTGYDATRAAMHRFALHRITGVAELESGE
ncbi:Helicase conserved C-terminal domain-containing protein [Thermomonospora echinospora]|uniref:Helicase conserved C-terminal domain-containing protein n=1 Tax=Thermomonospora echinospora TaxID=1992 RepID=A0A1H6E5C7_9ACTN|nr:helicase-associated domain-containing protein [Thermomonospora echinospora]SEG92409.1 Helicase conserved C-terminal domain-containing protein [Thermomonospora echinospora]